MIGGLRTNPEGECIEAELHERLMQFLAELSPSLKIYVL
jgi:hypothetical protein